MGGKLLLMRIDSQVRTGDKSSECDEVVTGTMEMVGEYLFSKLAYN